MVNISIPLLDVLDIYACKSVYYSSDLIFTGKGFHNKTDDVRKVLSPSVLLGAAK